MAQSQSVAVPRGQVWAAQLFLLSLLVPVNIQIGSLFLFPHRVVLLGLFVPFFLMLFVLGRGGRVLLADWCMFLAAFWAGASLFANHAFGTAIEPFGIHMVEFFGAYLVARIGIRSGADFRRMVKTLFLIVLILTPFAIAESVTHRAVLLRLIPVDTLVVVDAGVRLGLRRAQVIFAHPILFGVFVSTGLGLFWYALRPRWLRFPAVPLVAVATICSLSVGALIAFLLQALFIGWETVLKVLRWRWTLFAFLALMAYVAVDVLSNRTPFHVLATYASFSSGSAYNRILIWQHGTDNVWANPIFGLGLKDWVRPDWMKGSVDNFWLATTMTYGLPHLLLLGTALASIIRRVSRTVLPDPDDQLSRASYLVVIGALIIAGGTVHYWHAMLSFVAFIFGTGLWVATNGGLTSAASAPSEPDAPSTERRSRYTRQSTTGGRIGVLRPSTPSAQSHRRAQSAARTLR